MLNVDKYKSIRCCERFNILVGHQHRIFFFKQNKNRENRGILKMAQPVGLALKASDPLMICALAVGRHSFQRCIGELSPNEPDPTPCVTPG